MNKTEICYRAHPAAVDDADADGLVVWRADLGDVYSLNGTGAAIWRRLRSTASSRQIAAALAKETRADAEVVRGDVESLIDALLHAGLVQQTPWPAEDMSPAAPSPTTRAAALRFIGNAVAPDGQAGVPRRVRDGFWEAVARLAFHYRIAGLLWQRLLQHGRAHGLPQWLREHLATLHALTWDHNQQVRRQLDETVGALNDEGIEPLLLKGAALLVAGVYPDDGGRWLSDIDVLVHAEELPRAVAVMCALDYRAATPGKWDFSDHHHLAPMTRAQEECPIELHHEALPLSYRALLPAADLWAESLPAIGPLRCRLPCQRHRLIHAIAHAQLVDGHHARRTLPMRELCDYAWSERQAGAATVAGLPRHFAAHRAALAGFTLAAERLLHVTTPVGHGAGLAGRFYWGMARASVRWPRVQAWNGSLYRFSVHYLRSHGSIVEGGRPLRATRWRRLARLLRTLNRTP
ncbi:MAG: PqqD family peptide modification chaperone [Gammaproteobacteria bacterium]|nr:PqqD family peptide modification chaperone [Gammaproteobacteria bacterium]